MGLINLIQLIRTLKWAPKIVSLLTGGTGVAVSAFNFQVFYLHLCAQCFFCGLMSDVSWLVALSEIQMALRLKTTVLKW